MKFYYRDTGQPGEKILLNSRKHFGAFNQFFRPIQENVFTVLVPNWNNVDMTRVQVGFYDDPKDQISVPDDRLIIKRLHIYDHGGNVHYFLRPTKYITITKDSGMVVLQRHGISAHTVSPVISMNLKEVLE